MSDLPDRFLAALAKCVSPCTLADVFASLASTDRAFAAGVITHDLVACARCLRDAGKLTIEYDAKNRVDLIRAK